MKSCIRSINIQLKIKKDNKDELHWFQMFLRVRGSMGVAGALHLSWWIIFLKMALGQSEKELLCVKMYIIFKLLGMRAHHFTLKKVPAPVLSDPWRRLCSLTRLGQYPCLIGTCFIKLFALSVGMVSMDTPFMNFQVDYFCISFSISSKTFWKFLLWTYMVTFHFESRIDKFDVTFSYNVLQIFSMILNGILHTHSFELNIQF